MKELLDGFSVEELEAMIARQPEDSVGKLARIALAVKQAKPVCWAYTRDLPDLRKGHGVRIHGWGPNRRMMATPYQVQNSSPLYEVPPVEALPQPITVDLKDVDVDAVKQAFAKGMDRYSGAMLTLAAPKPIELTVWYGAMPESNGKTNWTAILHRKGEQVWDGITIDRSEYPDRVRYEADRMRYLIGELTEEPDILAYDADKHSGYVAPKRGPEGSQ